MQLNKNKGIGTIHLIIIFAMILTITASGAAVLSIVSQGLYVKEQSAKTKIDINNLFVFVDIIMREETAAAYEKTAQKILSDRSKENITSDTENQESGTAYSENEKIKFIKTFTANLKDARIGVNRSFQAESFYFKEMFGIENLYSKVELLYYDSRKGSEQFVPLDDFGVNLYPDNIHSSADIAMGIRVFVTNSEKENMEYIKYYYFDFDDKLESGELFEQDDLIPGASYYVKTT